MHLTLGDDLGALGLVNARPTLTQPPEEEKYTIAYGEGWSLDLGQTVDADNDTVRLNLTCASC